MTVSPAPAMQMPATQMPGEPNLVAGRSCGACTVCCIVPTIDEPALQKLPGYRCEHLSDTGCGVYASRPRTCREFFCGWRTAKWVGDALRPDTSGVLVVLGNRPDAVAASLRPPQPTASFALLNRTAVNAPGLAEAVAAAVAAGLNVLLAVPNQPGYTFTELRLNESLAEPVRRKDKAGVIKVLKAMRSQARSRQPFPVVLSSHAVRDTP